jgi:hypothetical protein
MGAGRALWRNRRAMGGESGQAVVEAALVLPLTVALILCAIQITQVQQARVLVEYAAFNAARAGVVQNGNAGSDGASGPMHDAAALSLLASHGRTDGLGALARTWADFRAREAVLSAAHLPLVQVRVLNPRRSDFQRLGQHLHGEEIDFDDVRPQAIDATLLSVNVRYLYELRVPFANQLLHSLWLAARRLRGAGGGAADGLDLAALSLASKQRRYLFPVQAFYTMRMQSNPFLRWAAP